MSHNAYAKSDFIQQKDIEITIFGVSGFIRKEKWHKSTVESKEQYAHPCRSTFKHSVVSWRIGGGLILSLPLAAGLPPL